MQIQFNDRISEKIKRITESKWLDLIGLIIVVGGSIALGFHQTIVDFSFFGNFIQKYPLGFQSVIGSSISLLVTRLVTRRDNIGNFIGIFTTISACMVEYLLGNHAAILTYPISFFGNMYIYRSWNQQSEIIPIGIDKGFYINFIYGFIISIVLNYIGFTKFLSTDIDPVKYWLFAITIVVSGLSFGGLFNTAKRYKDNWATWQFYNVIKFVQNVQLGNIPQLLKYIFYFCNASLGWITWNYVRRKKMEQ